MNGFPRATTAAAALAAMTAGLSAASALIGGGTAPSDRLSGSLRPACNGYNMDGTVKASPGANRPNCVDHSANTFHRPAVERRPRGQP